MADYIEVKNFERFQHYKRRNPPWIKLYVALLDDYEFGRLQDASKMHLVGIWLLASKLGNKIPDDAEWIARRIGATSPVELELLIGTGFIRRVQQPASKVLAQRKRVAMPETETETETEGESNKTTTPASAGRETEKAERPLKPGDVLGAVRKTLWGPDGKPPAGWSDGREMTVIKALVKRGETIADLLRAVQGLRLLQDQGEVDWLAKGTKVTLRAIYNSHNGSRDMLTQALDAHASGPPPAPLAPKSNARPTAPKLADFDAALASLRGAA